MMAQFRLFPAVVLHAMLAGALSALCACVGSGDLPARLSGQIVGANDLPLGPGLVLVERGKVHAGTYEGGGLIDAEGKFSVPLPRGGTWGIHLFHNDYSYLPVEVTIDLHQEVVLTNLMVAWGVWTDQTGLPTWPDQPDDTRLVRMPVDDTQTDNPVLSDIHMTYPIEGMLQITAKVFDPNSDLSRMVLVYDEATGAGYALNPPSPPDAKGRYPNGVYTLKLFLDPAHVPGKSVWHFVVSDNMCNNSPIIPITMPVLP
jgi:hypothetical protein